MQTPESVSDSLQRTVRSVDTGPTELEDLLPGSPQGDLLPGSRPQLESIRSAIDEAENAAADIERNTRLALRGQVADIAKGVESIQANLQGYIGNELDSAAKVSDKLAAKVSARIANGLTQAYADTVQLGFPVPTIEQVQYGNTTGDYLGSMVQPVENAILPVAPKPDLGIITSPLPTNIDRPTSRPQQTPIFRPVTQPTILPSSQQTPAIGQFIPGLEPQNINQTPLLPYSYPPGFGESDQWCSGNVGVNTSGQTPAEAAMSAGWTSPIGPTQEHPTDVSVRPTGWAGQPIFNGWVMPDYAGNCPVGLVPNGGTGTFFTACVPPVCQGDQPPQQPTVSECPPGYAYFDWDGVSPLPVGAVRVGDRICIPHPAGQIATCPLPAELTCGTKPTFPEITAAKPTENYCRDLEDWLNEHLANVPGIEHIIKTQFGSIGDSSWAKIIARAITGNDKPVIASLIDSFGKWLGEAAKSVVFSATCDKLQLTPIASVHGIIKFINQWFGIVPRAATQTLQQAENLVCQTVMPDQPSTDKAYLANEIDKDLWRCWTELNGSVVPAAEKGLETLRTRPTSEQVSKLFRRKQINEQEFVDRMRQNGVIHDKDRDAIHNLTQDWPSLSDLTPMLVRDVWDETTIDWTEVDRLFDAKYTDETKKYFDAIGLTRDVVKYYWRAHFHLPSFTMASEMYHRFRALPEGDPLRTDLEKVKSLLIQDDWHPDWIDRMLAITFRPMRLIDIRTAYDMRILDSEGLRDKLRILGYSDDDVATTERIWEKRRDIRDAKQGGFPSVKTLISQYANCEIDDHTFRYVLSFIVETPEQELKAVEAANVARDSEDNRRTIAGISWQYRRGLIDEGQAHQALAEQGIDPTCIPSLVRVWKSQTMKQPKQLAAASLCKMLEQGIISASEFVSALLRIGYTSTDADRIVRSCAIGLTQREIRKANQEAARLARERKAAEREAARLQRLAECGPPPCPRNRQTASQNGAVDQSSQGT